MKKNNIEPHESCMKMRPVSATATPTRAEAAEVIALPSSADLTVAALAAAVNDVEESEAIASRQPVALPSVPLKKLRSDFR